MAKKEPPDSAEKVCRDIAAFQLDQVVKEVGYQEALKQWCDLKRRARLVLGIVPDNPVEVPGFILEP